MLAVSGLKKRYGKRWVVQGVELEVRAGEVVGLLGPNGAGKTTCFRAIMGLITADEGQVSFLGNDVTHLPIHKRARLGMGYLPQKESVFGDLSVEKNLTIALERLPLSRKERKLKATVLLEEYGLLKIRKSMAGRASGGEKRRLEIARALITEPQLMLFDEPFAGVDPKNVGEVQKVVYGLRRKGIAVFITDHDARQILSTSDRVYLMHEGEVVVSGPPQKILDSEVARRVYLGENFKLDLSEFTPQGVSDEPSALAAVGDGETA
ncbi:MAG: LPS export ABC transporter ATP-binding protein [Planctomycetes bacterium]|nr:LPS export ABC transporter ATP-binding protein [Planctomycetota bacterium]